MSFTLLPLNWMIQKGTAKGSTNRVLYVLMVLKRMIDTIQLTNPNRVPPSQGRHYPEWIKT